MGRGFHHLVQGFFNHLKILPGTRLGVLQKIQPLNEAVQILISLSFQITLQFACPGLSLEQTGPFHQLPQIVFYVAFLAQPGHLDPHRGDQIADGVDEIPVGIAPRVLTGLQFQFGLHLLQFCQGFLQFDRIHPLRFKQALVFQSGVANFSREVVQFLDWRREMGFNRISVLDIALHLVGINHHSLRLPVEIGADQRCDQDKATHQKQQLKQDVIDFVLHPSLINRQRLLQMQPPSQSGERHRINHQRFPPTHHGRFLTLGKLQGEAIAQRLHPCWVKRIFFVG